MTPERLRIRAGLTNVFVLRERGTIVVDPGGPDGNATARNVLSLLGTPPRLDLIVVTHGHFDHRAAAGALRERTGAPVAAHRADLPLLAAAAPIWPGGVTRWGKFLRAALGPVVARVRVAPLEPDILIDDEGLDLAPFGVTGRVVHTPGHTRGSLSLVLSSGEAFVGDLAMNRLPACWRPSFGIFAEEPDRHRASWQRLVRLGARTAYPAHGRRFAVSKLRS